MPVRQVTKDGKSGYRWGVTGKVYTFMKGNAVSEASAKKKAVTQGKAIEISKRNAGRGKNSTKKRG